MTRDYHVRGLKLTKLTTSIQNFDSIKFFINNGLMINRNSNRVNKEQLFTKKVWMCTLLVIDDFKKWGTRPECYLDKWVVDEQLNCIDCQGIAVDGIRTVDWSEDGVLFIINLQSDRTEFTT